MKRRGDLLSRQHRTHRETTAEEIWRDTEGRITHFVSAMGMPPGEWLLMQRLAAAKTLLEETEAGVEAIAVQVGFGEAATLRSHFRRRLGTSPGGYRKRFRI